MPVEMARKLHSIQDPREHLFWIRASQYSTEHLDGAVSPVLALAMSVMMLDVVVLPPCLVGLLNLWPSACIGEGMVREPALDRKQRFRIILPRLTWVNTFLADT